MANIIALKNRIRAAIKANDNQEITGPVLQQSLLDIVDELDLNPELENEAQQRQNADTQLNNLIIGIKNNINASNVTYNHNDSQLNATNVQQAIDEVRKRSNYNDGDNIIDFNTINIIKDNPMWLFLLVDANDKFIYGIKREDGQPHWGVGIPKVVKDYVDKQINDILGTNNITETIDSLKEVENFLKDFSNSDTLKALLDNQAKNIEDKYQRSNPNDEEGNVTDTKNILKLAGNKKFVLMLIDSLGKVFDAVGKDGIRKIFTDLDIKGALHLVTNNPRFIFMLTDSEDKFIVGIDRKTGTPIYGFGVPKQVKEYIDAEGKARQTADQTLKESIEKATAAVSKEIIESVAKLLDKFFKVSISKGNIIFTDIEEKVLFVIGLNNEIKSFLPINIQDAVIKVTNSPDFSIIFTDKDNRVFAYVTRKGEFKWIKGVPQVIKSYISDYVDKAVTEYHVGNDVVARNQDKDEILHNACRFGDIDTRDSSYTWTKRKNKDFQLEIITDTHASPLSIQNAVKCANGFETIDAIIHCGDIANWWYGSDYSYIQERMKDMAKSEKPWFVVIGNHDVAGDLNTAASNEDAYSMYIKPMVDANILKEGEYQENKCYYYHDFVSTDEKKYSNDIRLIVLYDYDNPLTFKDNDYWEPIPYNDSYPKGSYKSYTYDENNPIYMSWGSYRGSSFRLKKSVIVNYNDKESYPQFTIYRNARIFSKEQMQWLVDTLNSTPEGYGVIIATHMPFSGNADNQTEMKFADKKNTNGTGGGETLQTDLLADIANAYNSKTTLNEKVVFGKTYLGDASVLNTQTDESGNKYAYEFVANFTNAKAQIYGFIGGHRHLDLIYKHNTYSNLYGIYPICGTYEPPYVSGSDFYSSDVSRSKTDSKAFDAITITSWAKGRIALARVGNTSTITGKQRDFEIIDINK